uniref:RRM domain-containing protein n=1 Tax=Aplanochytrium stocchinoi TaxID=215587 RepID=A0A6S7ZZ95_9STRA|mmetsp:Transcript_26895/g.32571  ORF Transcript_26895/g.32571 Transcript_26895/m.32571 type:complete len:105 (-) Transcript_26895:651-965(-)
MSGPVTNGNDEEDSEVLNEEVAQRTVTVSNLHNLVTLGKVKDLFSQVGEIEIVYRASKTAASVVFADKMHVQPALLKSGTVLEGESIVVSSLTEGTVDMSPIDG